MKYIVELVSTFREIHVVEAENEETAIKIAQKSDYNMSKWLGQQVSTIYDYSEIDINRLKKEDQYFDDTFASVDSEGFLVYKNLGSNEYVRSYCGTKIV